MVGENGKWAQEGAPFVSAQFIIVQPCPQPPIVAMPSRRRREPCSIATGRFLSKPRGNLVVTGAAVSHRRRRRRRIDRPSTESAKRHSVGSALGQQQTRRASCDDGNDAHAGGISIRTTDPNASPPLEGTAFVFERMVVARRRIQENDDVLASNDGRRRKNEI